MHACIATYHTHVFMYDSSQKGNVLQLYYLKPIVLCILANRNSEERISGHISIDRPFYIVYIEHHAGFLS